MHQILLIVRLRPWRKYNKHHHKLKTTTTMLLYEYVYKENILADGTILRVHRKRDNQQLKRVLFVFWVKLVLLFLQSAEFKYHGSTRYKQRLETRITVQLFNVFFIDWIKRCLILPSKFKIPRVNLFRQTILQRKFMNNLAFQSSL